MKGVANIKCVSAIYLCSTIKKQKTMVDINDVIWAFEQGEIEKESGNILIAARYYRIANIALSHCELPRRIFMPEETNRKIDNVCDNVWEMFHSMNNLLTATQRAMLRSEESSHRVKVDSGSDVYQWRWRDLIKYDYEMILRDKMLLENPDFPKYVF